VARTAYVGTLVALGVALAGCKGKNETGGNSQGKTQAAGPIGAAGVTPMADRVAVLGLLNKRNGIVRDVALRPGQSAKWRDVIVRLRACEKTAPWEEEDLTGAFVQVDVQRADRRWGRVFSGWLYKESPSLNVVEHPVYDVWVKSCEMTFPEGPAAPATPSRSSSASSAPKSPSPVTAPAPPAPSDATADASNTA
jgi:hypothetical protein